jgi:hypothetical protein
MFQRGDKIKVTNIKYKNCNAFTVGKIYTIGGKFYDNSSTHWSVVADDNGQENGHRTEYIEVELVKEPIPVPITSENPVNSKVLGNEQNVFFDVDDTIAMHVEEGCVADFVLYNDAMECNIAFQIHKDHVKQIKSHKNRGFSVFVWSGNGSAWAKKVIEALELQDYVDYYMTKPVKFFDDLPAEKVLVNRVYLDYKE